MSLAGLTNRRSDLAVGISHILSRAFGDFRQNEPQLVANLVFHLTRGINNASIRSIFQSCNCDISAGGVFVHQQPQVSCSSFPSSSTRAVEIGDLLLVISFTNGRGGTVRRALLLQAKKALRHFRGNPGNTNQHHLYAFWPTFSYVRAGSLNGQSRSVNLGDVQNGCKYLMLGPQICVFEPFCIDFDELDPRVISMRSCTAFPTYPDLSGFRSFVGELLNLLLVRGGERFHYEPDSSNQSWDRVVTDLITLTANRISIYMGRASGTNRQESRGQGVFLVNKDKAILKTLFGKNLTENYENILFGGEEPPNIGDYESVDNDEGAGMSIVEVMIAEEPGEYE